MSKRCALLRSHRPRRVSYVYYYGATKTPYFFCRSFEGTPCNENFPRSPAPPLHTVFWRSFLGFLANLQKKKFPLGLLVHILGPGPKYLQYGVFAVFKRTYTWEFADCFYVIYVLDWGFGNSPWAWRKVSPWSGRGKVIMVILSRVRKNDEAPYIFLKKSNVVPMPRSIALLFF